MDVSGIAGYALPKICDRAVRMTALPMEPLGNKRTVEPGEADTIAHNQRTT